LAIFFGLEWLACSKLENFTKKEKLEVLSWVTMSENFVQMILFFLDFFMQGNEMSVFTSLFPIMSSLFFWMGLGKIIGKKLGELDESYKECV